jgi:hypothetical protein
MSSLDCCSSSKLMEYLELLIYINPWNSPIPLSIAVSSPLSSSCFTCARNRVEAPRSILIELVFPMTGAINSGDSNHLPPRHQAMRAPCESLDLPVFSPCSIVCCSVATPYAYSRRRFSSSSA